MDRTRRSTYTPSTDNEAARRSTVSERPVGKTEKARASTLLALGLAEEKDEALTEASLLSADVDNADEITAGSYTVQILGTDLAAKKAGKAYTVYKVEITHDISTWIIYRRYSQFYALLEELKSSHGKKVSKGFPPKKFVHNLSPASIDRRHQQLQDWLQTVLNDKWVVGSTALQLFIKAGKEDADFVPRQHASTIESDIDMATTLHKYDGSKWKSRWFVLRHGRLYKYNSPQNKHPYGFYDLRQCRAVPLAEAADVSISSKNSRSHAFVVDAVNQRTGKSKRYIFASDNDDTMKSWVANINQEFVANDHNKVFGVPIANVRDRDDNGVPLFLSALLTFLEATALDQEDLFTKPPDEEIKRAIDRGKSLDLAKVAEDAHAVAGLIVQYLHELPDAIIPEDICPAFYGLFQIKDTDKRLRMLATLSEILPIINRNLLIKLFSFLNHASQGAVRRERLSKIFGRIIFRVAGDHQINLNFIAEQLMEHWDTLVVLDEVYAAPEKILVVKKKKGSSKEATAGVADATANKQSSKPAFNDYYDSNEELEESSEEEDWSDEEIQVISEISEYSTSEEDYDKDEESEEEEEYAEEDLIDELTKAAAEIPDIEPVEVKPKEESPSLKGSTTKSHDTEVSSEILEDQIKQEKQAIDDKEIAAIKPKESKKKDSAPSATTASVLSTSSDILPSSPSGGTKSRKELRAAEKAAATAASEASASEKTPAVTVDKSLADKSTTGVIALPQAEPVMESPAKSERKHKRERTDKTDKTDKTEKTEKITAIAVAVEDESKPSKKRSKKDISAEGSDKSASEVTSNAADSTTSSTTATTSSMTTPTRLKKSGKKGTKKSSKRDLTSSQASNSANASASKSSSDLGLDLSAVEQADPEIGSPNHRPLLTPIASRPKKHGNHIPSNARAPHAPQSRPQEPQRTPQEQLVADLGRVLGRRPVGGIAMFPVSPKKAAE